MSKRILYDAIKAKIDSIEGMHCSGLFNDQFNQEPDEDALRYPVVFVQFEPIEWRAALGTNRNLQEATIDVILHVGFKRLDKDNESVLDDVDRLYFELEGFASDDFDPLRRIREVQDIGYNNTEVWQLIFRTTLRDCTASMKGTIKHTITALDARTESSLKIDNDVIRSGSTEGLSEDE